MSLDDLEKRLRTRTKMSVRRSATGKKKAAALGDIPAWLRRAVVFGGAFTLLVVIVGLLLIFFYTSGGRNVSVALTVPQTVTRGEPFNVEVDVVNNTGAPLDGSVIRFDLPPGVINWNGSDPNIISDAIGDLPVGSLTKRTYSLMPTGSVGELETLTAALDYSSGPGTQFEEKRTAAAKIDGEVLAVSATPPAQILSGSTFSLPVIYVNNSDFDFPAVTIGVDYPDNFKFDSASVAPSSLNNYWQLGELKPHASGTLVIVGHLVAGSDSGTVLPIKLSASFDGSDYPLAETDVALTPSPSPVSLNVLVNGTTAYVAHIGDTLQYAIQYQNLSGVALSNVVIKATLVGDLLDLGTLTTAGRFDSGTQTVTWDSANDPGLATLAPGAGGTANVQIALKNQFGASAAGSGNSLVQMSVVMTSPTVPPYLSTSHTTAQAVVSTKVSGLVNVSAQGFFRDAQSGIVNAGNLPPTVGTSTEYTVHWDIANYGTDISNITVSAPLPSGVMWTGQVKSNIDSMPTYNASSGVVTWNIGSIASGRGVSSPPVEAIFQVAATPSPSQIGQFEPILGATALSANDSFTGVPLQSQAGPVTTALPDDTTVGPSQGLVAP